MTKDRNTTATSVPTEQIEILEKGLKKRKCFEGVILQEIDNISCKGVVRINNTNYKNVCVVKKGNIFTYLALVSRKSKNKKIFKWWKSFSDVKIAAKAVDTKLLEYGYEPINFKFKLISKENVKKSNVV